MTVVALVVFEAIWSILEVQVFSRGSSYAHATGVVAHVFEEANFPNVAAQTSNYSHLSIWH